MPHRHWIGPVALLLLGPPVLCPPAQASPLLHASWNTRYEPHFHRKAHCGASLTLVAEGNEIRLPCGENLVLAGAPLRRPGLEVMLVYRVEDYTRDVERLRTRLAAQQRQALAAEVLPWLVTAWTGGAGGVLKELVKDLALKSLTEEYTSSHRAPAGDWDAAELAELAAELELHALYVSGLPEGVRPTGRSEGELLSWFMRADVDAVLESRRMHPGLGGWRGVAPTLVVSYEGEFGAFDGGGAWPEGGAAITGLRAQLALPWELMVPADRRLLGEATLEHARVFRPYFTIRTGAAEVGPGTLEGQVLGEDATPLDTTSVDLELGSLGLGGALRYQNRHGLYLEGGGGVRRYGSAARLVLSDTEDEEAEEVEGPAVASAVDAGHFAFPYAELELGVHPFTLKRKAAARHWLPPVGGPFLALGFQAGALPTLTPGEAWTVRDAETGEPLALPTRDWNVGASLRGGFAF